MSKFKYTKEDVLKEMQEALSETEPSGVGTSKTAKPNILQLMRSKKEMGNEGKTWPLV